MKHYPDVQVNKIQAAVLRKKGGPWSRLLTAKRVMDQGKVISADLPLPPI